MDMTEFAEKLAIRYLRTKSPAWEYEREARMIRTESGPFKFQDVLLTEICFGLQTSKSDFDLVAKLAENYWGCVNRNQMERSETEFRLVKKPR